MTFLIDATKLLEEYELRRAQLEDFARIAPTEEQRFRSLGAAEVLKSMRDGLEAKMAQIAATAGVGSGTVGN